MSKVTDPSEAVQPASAVSTRKKRSNVNRLRKSYKEFPLTPHNSGKWMKKILGTIHYFGRWGTEREQTEKRSDFLTLDGKKLLNFTRPRPMTLTQDTLMKWI